MKSKQPFISRGLMPVLTRLIEPGDTLFVITAYVDMKGVVYLMENLPLEKAVVFFSKVIPMKEENYEILANSPIWDKVFLLQNDDFHHHEKIYVIVHKNSRKPPIVIFTSANLTYVGLTGNTEHVLYKYGISREIASYFHLIRAHSHRVFPFVENKHAPQADTISPIDLGALLNDIMIWESKGSISEDNFIRNGLLRIEGQIKDAIRIIWGYVAGERGRFIISEPGTGKTIITGMALRYLLDNKLANRVLIVTKKNISFQWQDELYEKFDIDSTQINSENIPDIAEADNIVAITTYQMLLHHIDRILATRRWDIVVFDESDYRMAREIKTRQAIKKWHHLSKYILLLTATPVRHSVDELFSQMAFITSDIEIETLKSLIKKKFPSPFINLSITRRTLKDLGVDIPQDCSYQEIFVDLSPGERHLYETIRVYSGHAAGLYLSHPHLIFDYQWGKEIPDDIKEEIKRTIKHIEDFTPFRTTLSLVSKHVQEGESVVLFVRFRKTGQLLKMAMENMGIKAEFLHGGTPDNIRKSIIKGLGTEHSALILVRGVMEGLNLQSSNVLINYDVPPSYGTLVQRIGRIYRIGQEKSTYIYTIITKNTPEAERYLKLKALKEELKDIIPEGVLDQIIVFLEGETEETAEGWHAEDVKAMAHITSEIYDMAALSTLIEEFTPPDPALYHLPISESDGIEGLQGKHFITDELDKPLYVVKYTMEIGDAKREGFALWNGKDIVDSIPTLKDNAYIKALEDNHIPGENMLMEIIKNRYAEVLDNLARHIDSIAQAYYGSEDITNIQLAIEEHLPPDDITVSLHLWSKIGKS